MSLGSERKSVQEPIIKYTSSNASPYSGWTYIAPDEINKLRDGYSGFILKDIFIKQVKKLNPFINDEQAQTLLKEIIQVPPKIEGNLIVWEFLNGMKTVYLPDENRERNVKLIDKENIHNNVFNVTDEFEFTNNLRTIRQDHVYFINGIPILFVETKAANTIDGMNKAFNQIKRYHEECPELLTIEQIFALTHIHKFYYGASWNLSVKSIFNWKEETSGNFETLVESFFNRERIVKLITDYILFTKKDDSLQKIVLRPHQTRAVEKIILRAKDENKSRGLIWHTQGSGKTYTMIVAAHKILSNPIFENPTIILLVDRNELETQMFQNAESLKPGSVIVARSKEELKKLLQSDYRGIIISMIHKFDDMPEKINTRKNIFVLVDEAHRTTGGKLGNYLMGALPNATYIGFTGTPIDKTTRGSGTFIIFGRDDEPHGYLDKYSIAESIDDGTTIPLNYTLAPNDLLIDRKTLEKEFLELKDAEGISDVEELNKILDRAVNLKNMLKNYQRVKKVAEYVADHFRKYIEPLGYKAFLVAVDREACVLYKNELDKYLPKEYSEVVISPFYNDSIELKKYHHTEEEEKRIRKKFLNPDENPKILIVTEKLLTGFDAPILYCMYLDKPMRDHILLQAIARVNRPYEDNSGRQKRFGFVLDFVGIFYKLEKALSFDSPDIEGIINDINLLKQRFVALIEEAENKYLNLISDKSDDKAVEELLDYFRDDEVREKFMQFYRELLNIYEILSPDAFLSPYMELMEKLTNMYRIVKEAYSDSTLIDSEFSKKVEHLVRKHTKTDQIKPALEIFEINEKTIQEIQKRKKSDLEKVFNLAKSIQVCVFKNAQDEPYLIQIGEKALKVIEEFKNRQINTLQALEKVKQLIEEINNARKEQIEKGLDKQEFSIQLILKNEGISNFQQIGSKIFSLIEKFPYWKTSEQQKRQIKIEIISILMNEKYDFEKSTLITNKLLMYLSGNKNA